MKSTIVQVLIVSILVIIVFLMLGDFENFFSERLTNNVENKIIYSSLSLVLLVSDVLLPIPSSLIIYSNGYVLGFGLGLLLSLLSLTAGSIVGYALGRFGFVLMRKRDDPRKVGSLRNYGPSIIILTRCIPILSEALSIVSGYNRVEFGRYITLSIIGYIPFCIIYSLCGSLGFANDMFLLTLLICFILTAALWFAGLTRNSIKL